MLITVKLSKFNYSVAQARKNMSPQWLDDHCIVVHHMQLPVDFGLIYGSDLKRELHIGTDSGSM